MSTQLSKIRIIQCFCLCACFLCALPIQATIYQWKDAQGIIHYSDPPNAQANAKIMNIQTPTASVPKEPSKETPSTLERLKKKEQKFKEQQQKQKDRSDKAQKEQVQLEAQKKNCMAIQNMLTALKQKMRIASPNENGEPEFLSDQQRQEKIDNLTKTYEEQCKDLAK